MVIPDITRRWGSDKYNKNKGEKQMDLPAGQISKLETIDMTDGLFSVRYEY